MGGCTLLLMSSSVTQKRLVSLYRDVFGHVIKGKSVTSLDAEAFSTLSALSLEIREVLTFRSLEKNVEKELIALEEEIRAVLATCNLEDTSSSTKQEKSRGKRGDVSS